MRPETSGASPGTPISPPFARDAPTPRCPRFSPVFPPGSPPVLPVFSPGFPGVLPRLPPPRALPAPPGSRASPAPHYHITDSFACGRRFVTPLVHPPFSFAYLPRGRSAANPRGARAASFAYRPRPSHGSAPPRAGRGPAVTHRGAAGSSPLPATARVREPLSALTQPRSRSRPRRNPRQGSGNGSRALSAGGAAVGVYLSVSAVVPFPHAPRPALGVAGCCQSNSRAEGAVTRLCCLTLGRCWCLCPPGSCSRCGAGLGLRTDQRLLCHLWCPCASGLCSAQLVPNSQSLIPASLTRESFPHFAVNVRTHRSDSVADTSYTQSPRSGLQC